MNLLKMKKTQFLVFVFLIACSGLAMAQNNRSLSTGVSMLLINPESRGAGMGEVSAASTPDANSSYGNNSKYAFIESPMGVSLSYSPWLIGLSGKDLDMNLLYLSGYGKINERITVGAYLHYFSYGKTVFTDDQGDFIKDHTPTELSVGGIYSMKLTDKLSAGLTGKYIRSNLMGDIELDGTFVKPANAVAADIGLYYTSKIENATTPSEYAIGLSINNLGSKVSYADEVEKDFLPQNIRLGGRYTMDFDQYNKLSLMLDFTKLLIPTPPIYEDDGITIKDGKDPDVGILKGAIQSFYDAPDGFKEEMQEIMISFGAEYLYTEWFAARAGYFYENKNKGGRQYLTLGVGLKYNAFGLDISYLVPTTKANNNPLKNTLRFSLSYELAKNAPKTITQ